MAGARQAEIIDLAVQPGLFMQRSSRQSPGRYVNGSNVRWYRGLPQKMGGFVEELAVDTNGNRVWYKGHSRSCKQWDSLDGQNWIAFGTEYKLYLLNQHILYNITPLRTTTTIVNGFATQAGQLLITVTDPAHGAQVGDFVTYSGASAVGNVNLNREFPIQAVIDLNTYLIALDVPASTTNAAGGGNAVAAYEWPIGLTSDGTLTGFGTGTYGTQAYGTPRTGSTFGGFARIWSLDNWGEDLLACPNGDALFWWQRQSGPDSRAILRPNAPAQSEHMLVGPDDRHVILLGTNLLGPDAATVTGQQDKMFMRWCTGDNFDDWVPREGDQAALGNDAGSKRLDTGSRLITAVKTRTSVVIFSDEGLYAVGLVGGTDVYQVTPIGGAVKIISAGAAVDVFGVVYYMTTQGFGFFNGAINDLPCDVAEFVFGSPDRPRMNRQMQSKVTAEVRADFFEIRWHFPSVDSDENDSVVVYNWQMGVWYVSQSSLARESSLDKNVFYGVPVGFNDTGIYLEETGYDVDTEEGLPNFLDTWEGELSMFARSQVSQVASSYNTSAGQYFLVLHSLYPDFKPPSDAENEFPQFTGSVDVQVRGRDFSGDSLVYGDVLTVTPDIDQIDPQFAQRRVSIHMESYVMGTFWRMDYWRALSSPSSGRRG